jgi:putative PIG3 family NAD(P)H quinone oxidoreductase
MRALIYEGSAIKNVELPAPVLKPGQIRIKVHASGVNRADLAQRKGVYPPPPGESDVPGLEAAGVVLETSGSRFKAGDRVMALLGSGGYADEVCVDEGLAMPLPDRLSFTQGAGIPETFVTVHLNFFQIAGLKSGGRALVHAGASGVGTAAIQLLRARGIEVFATAGTAQKVALCESLGARGINYKEQKFDEAVIGSTSGAGVGAILDPVGASNLDADLRCLAPGGWLIVIGTMGGKDAKVDLGGLLLRRQKVVGSSLRGLPLKEKTAAVAKLERDFMTDLTIGRVAPVIDSVFSSARAAEAQERMGRNLNAGKIVLTWG